MAKSNVDIQLGSLDFDGIKNSIIDHLKKQNTLKDYDYEGSAMQVLLDVLAYNTSYYGFYSNMLASEMFLDTAQKESSLISLVKPLGYLVPGAKSARALVKIRQGGTNGTVPRYTRFSGTSSSGISYNFYTIEEYGLDLNGEAVISIVQGKSLTKEQPILIDSATQKGFILGLDVDISTIRLEVLDYNGDGTWVEWARAGNIEQGLDDTSQVYWLERSDMGFFVIFGGNLENSAYVQVGRSLKSNDLVRLSYLKSEGERGNQLGNFSVNGFSATTETVSLSSGGSNGPDLESIRFFAPKWFAAQDRAVTVEDCRALLAAKGFVSDSSNPYSNFNVWGGEEMNPPRYGRLFVSLGDTTEENPVAATKAIDILEQKTCVTVLPEFMDVDRFYVEVYGKIYYEPLETSLDENTLLSMVVKNIFDNNPNGFRQTYDSGVISNNINSLNAAFYVGSNDIKFKVSNNVQVFSQTPRSLIKFRNECESGSLITTEFMPGSAFGGLDDDQKIYLKSYGNVSNGKQSIIAAYFDEEIEISLGSVGHFIPNTGDVVFIKPMIAAEDFSLSVDITSTGTNTFINKEEMYAITRTNLEIVKRNLG